ncbi:MAG: ABC-F family ATP-binding cassette domain-containing protein, partial [Bacteroidales bacterium]|nr:ABC-F family ATP-binding cassette domain-containing protein [Candidatus Physcousia equi]
MISINNLCVEFSTRPLFTDVSFVVNDRERIALMGKNGAGKSTMLKIIAGLQEPTQGCVSIPKETTVAYLPQVMNLSDGCTVLEECRKAYDHPRIKNDEPWRKEADMDRILRGMGFEGNDFDRPTSELSGGWRMRIELAKLLLQRPDVLLLDEPT